jgi:glycosyltransferase involved in cell wall biosynthesis
VLGQTLQDLETIVVDDGSPEPCSDFLVQFADDRRITLIRQENLGLPQARNTGITRSASPYLVFLDADDWLAPAFCERLHEALAREQHLGFVYCDIHEVFEEGLSQPDNVPPYSVGDSRRVTSGDLLGSLLVGGYFPPMAAMVPRAVLEQVGCFDAELGGHADWDLWLRIAAAGYPARYIDDKLAYYRRHSQSMSLDREHMRDTRRRTLQKLFRSSPERAATTIDGLMQNVDEQFKSNQALQQELQGVRREAAAYFEESQRWMASLQEAKSWQEQQATGWKSRFEEAEQWTASLEEAKNWHEQQAATWKSRFEELERSLASERPAQNQQQR